MPASGGPSRLATIERSVLAAALVALLLIAGAVWLRGVRVAEIEPHAEQVRELEVELLRLEAGVEAVHDQGGSQHSRRAVAASMARVARLCHDSGALSGVPLPTGAADDADRSPHPCALDEQLIDAVDAQLAVVDADGGFDAIADDHFHDVIDAMLQANRQLDLSTSRALVAARTTGDRLLVGIALVVVALLALVGLLVRQYRRGTEELHEAVLREANSDALTGLGNRSALRGVLDGFLAAGRPTALLFMDLDGFKAVNDAAGHAVGDEVLIEVARRLEAIVRAQDVVVRLGGDEYAVVCPGMEAGDAAALGRRILQALRPPITVDGHTSVVSASIGVTTVRDHVRTRADLMRQADIAMYMAKSRGGRRVEVFTYEMQAQIFYRLALREDLAEAVMAGRIEVHYQPIIDLKTMRVSKFEALARWTHPDRGVIPPDVFIALAEEAGLINALGERVLRTACADLRRWHEAHPTARHLGVAVNASTLQVQSAEFRAQVLAALHECGLAPGDLTIEITEGALAAANAETDLTLSELAAWGVRLAVDDFGTGHSSLSRVRDLPVHELKIDRSFVAATDEGDGAKALVVSILSLARSQGLDVVAEGIESDHHLAFLTGYACEFGQGYLFSKPVSAEAAGRLLAQPAVVGTGPSASPINGGGVDATVGHVGHLGSPDDTSAMRDMLRRLAEVSGLETAYLTHIRAGGQEQEIAVAEHLGEPLVQEGLRVPWEDTLCRRALAVGITATARAPEVFDDAPVVADLGIQTYVGVPVSAPDGSLYGTLCAASRHEREVEPQTLRLMEAFARLITMHLHRGGRRSEADDLGVPPTG